MHDAVAVSLHGLPAVTPTLGTHRARRPQRGYFTLRMLAERVRFELTGLSSSGFQVWVRVSAGVR